MNTRLLGLFFSKSFGIGMAIFLGIKTQPALAGGRDTDILQSSPCIGLDGVPITAGALSQQCCPDGILVRNPPAICRAGFNTIQGDAVGGAAFNLNLAQQTLGVANQLLGSNTNFNPSSTPLIDGLTASGPIQTSLSGLVGSSAGGAGAGRGGAPLQGLGDSIAGDSSRSGSGRGAGSGGMGGGGASGGLGGSAPFESSTQGLKRDTASTQDENAAAGGRGGFVAAGSDGAGGSGNGLLNFGMGGSGGEGSPGGSALPELSLGEQELIGDGSGQVEGTVVDPSNYFSLTHPTDNLFQIVSRRYVKKINHLANSAPQRLPAGKPIRNKPF